MQIGIKYVNTSQTRLERLTERLRGADKLNLSLFILALIAVTISMLDWYAAKSFLNAVFHGL